MNVAQYLFQSPYSSAVQVGRLDPNSKQEESSVSAQSAPTMTQSKPQPKALPVEVVPAQETKPSAEPTRLLDVVA